MKYPDYIRYIELTQAVQYQPQGGNMPGRIALLEDRPLYVRVFLSKAASKWRPGSMPVAVTATLTSDKGSPHRLLNRGTVIDPVVAGKLPSQDPESSFNFEVAGPFVRDGLRLTLALSGQDSKGAKIAFDPIALDPIGCSPPARLDIHLVPITLATVTNNGEIVDNCLTPNPNHALEQITALGQALPVSDLRVHWVTGQPCPAAAAEKALQDVAAWFAGFAAHYTGPGIYVGVVGQQWHANARIKSGVDGMWAHGVAIFAQPDPQSAIHEIGHQFARDHLGAGKLDARGFRLKTGQGAPTVVEIPSSAGGYHDYMGDFLTDQARVWTSAAGYATVSDHLPRGY